MTGGIVLFEWRYHTRQVSFLAAVLVFFAFGFAFTATEFGPDNVHIDSPYSIAESIGVLSLVSLFVLAAFCANTIVRDREYRLEEMVFTTSVTKLSFLAGRFTGSFLAAFTAFCASAAGMYAARFMPWHDADRLGTGNALHYLWALAVVALPNILFAAVVLFAVATVTRNVLASYAASVVLYVLYFVAASLTNSPLMASSVPGSGGGATPWAILDPFALSAFFEQTRHWTAVERNTRLLSLSGNLLLNRLTWIGASFAGLAIVYRLFQFRVLARSRGTSAAAGDPAEGSLPGAPPDTVPETTADVRQADNPWQAFRSATRLEIRAFLLGAPFAALTLLWAALAAFEIVADLRGNEYGSALYPAAGVLFRSLSTPLSLLGSILLVYFTSEIVWRERTVGMAPLLHATRAPNAVFVFSKWTALAMLVVVLTATGAAAGIVVQIASGDPVDAWAWLTFAWLHAVPLILFAAIAIALQTLIPHKYAGMLVVLLVLVAGQRGELFGLDHPLVRFVSPSAFPHSDLTGFGSLAAFHWPAAYWASFAGLLLTAAVVRWRPGTVAGIRPAVPVALALVFVACGAVIFHHANILQPHMTEAGLLAWKADYEKEFRGWATRPQPSIAAIRARVDLHPGNGSYRVRGDYVLVNETTKPVADVLIAVRRDASRTSIAVPNARQTHDARFNQFLVRLDEPLRPGQRTSMRFDVTYANRSFLADDASVVENGSYLMSFRAFPTIGYRASYEIEDPRERRRLGLAAMSPAAQPEIAAREWVGLDLTVATAPDQIAIAPGRLVRTWNEGGRRLFHYRSDTPVLNQFAIASARYAVRKEQHGRVAIEIAFHPAHTANLDRMMNAAKDSLTSFEGAFGPYPHPHLRIVEVPSHWNFGGFATPGMIVLRDTGAFLVDARDPRRLDLVYRRVAHEVAHQWWGYTVVAADRPGGTTLTESLTKYAELLVMERAYGREAVRQQLTYELDRYLEDRTGETAAEPGLEHAGNQSYLYYRKGAIVMSAIKELIGAPALHSALRALVDEQGGPHRSPTTADLLRHIHTVTPPQHHALVDEWLRDVVLYDLSVHTASARRLPDGRYEIRLRVVASKQRDGGAALPMSEPVEIGLFSLEGNPLSVTKHLLRNGPNDLVVLSAQEPAFAAVDPYLTRIDRNRFDNGRAVVR